MVAAVGGATTFGIRIAEAAEGGTDGPAGAEITMVPGAGAEVTAFATTAGEVDRFTGFIWEGAAAIEVGAGGATPAGLGVAAAEAATPVVGGVLMMIAEATPCSPCSFSNLNSKELMDKCASGVKT